MQKKIDYKQIYQTVYKNLPNIWLFATFIIGTIASVVLGIFFFAEEEAGVGALLIIFGILISLVLAFIDRWIVSVVISQKVVVADALLEMNGSVSKDVDSDDELPEL
ncbi:MAG: hypothetical protein IKJ35_06075 [Clostridia bacterium]|nr:hypothetical protein [Clostridia bacterium]